MPSTGGGIATRQNSAVLYSKATPLAAGASVTSPAVGIAGYAQVIFSILADQPFSLLVEEANDNDGPWTPVMSLDAVPVGGLYRVSTRIKPVGALMRATIQNSAIAEKSLSAAVYGLPL